MSIELTVAAYRPEPARMVGTVTLPAYEYRRVEIRGIRNTAGEPELYVAHLRGFYADGSLRFDVDVQRSNGGFARLNSNRHGDRIARIGAAIRAAGLDEYRAACAGVA